MSSHSSSENITSSDEQENIEGEIDYVDKLFRKRYWIVKYLGSGACSSVWTCYDLEDKVWRAIKIHFSDSEKESDVEGRFLKKFTKDDNKFLPKMYHEFELDDYHVCHVIDILGPDVHYLKKKYSEEETKHLTRQVLNCLSDLNYKYDIIHTDVKPENILRRKLKKSHQAFLDYITSLNPSELYDDIKEKAKEEFPELPEELNVSPEYKSSESESENDNEKYKDIYKQNFETYVWSKFIGKIRPKIAIYETKYRLDMWKNGEEDDEEVLGNEFTLVDYGLSFDYKEKDRDDYPERIQTRYYICPEVLAEQKYNETCDMWSIGCMVYEWLTGETLFRPDSDKDFDRDCYHMKLMWLKVGAPSKEIQKEVRKWDLPEIEDINPFEKDLSDIDHNNPDLLSFMRSCLKYRIKDRMNSKQALEHKWLTT